LTQMVTREERQQDFERLKTKSLVIINGISTPARYESS